MRRCYATQTIRSPTGCAREREKTRFCTYAASVFAMSVPASVVAFALELANEADAMLRAAAQARVQTTMKPDKTFVTDLDLAIEARLRERIVAAYPNHGIWGEEFAVTAPDAQYVWTLDPIDGTMAFVAGSPVYSTLIALCERGVPVLGVMHFPATDERWVGVQGGRTTYNGTACNTADMKTLGKAIMTASSPDFFKQPEEKSALNELVQHTAWRVYGTAAMAYGRLASGRTHIAIDAGLKTYDYAPFVPIIEGAGGRITDWQGDALHLRSGSHVLAAASAALHVHALAHVKQFAP
jgi:inositol-phosphate phosphatase / L-galactose 1-phosphate phosphatase / histidinol-phosphatase